MTTYNTGNSLGSVDVRDLYDNAENTDLLTVGPLSAYADRLGVSRKSWKGMELDFAAFLAASGFELPAIEYTGLAPLVIDRPTQLIFRTGFPDTLYGVKSTESFPATLTGTWATDEARLVVRSDGDLRQDLADTTGATLVGHRGRLVSSVLDDSISVVSLTPEAFDPTSSWNAVFDAAVAFNGVVRIPSGVTVYLQNWVPAVDCTIIAYGATICRLNDTMYMATGSSAAIVAEDGTSIELLGGRLTEGAGATSATWSGGVLTNGGDFYSDGTEYFDLWAGVFGSANQDGVKTSAYVSLVNCNLHDCSHNTYCADIENFLVQGCHSHHSSRDGIRTYRNVQNVTVTGCHIHDNGAAVIGQSQDGIDLYIAGKNCIITDNHIYNNFTKGIDIKRGSEGAPVQADGFIIQNNYIWGNGDSGIEIDGNFELAASYISGVKINGNNVYGNTLWGILVIDAISPDISLNKVTGNLRDGIRVEGSVGCAIVTGNAVYGNGTPSGVVGTGISILAGNESCIVKNNAVTASPGGNQTNGISVGCPGKVKDNYVSGHTSNYPLSVTSDIVGQQTIVPVVVGITLCFIAPKDGVIVSAALCLGVTGTATVSLSKRNATTGASDGTLLSAASVPVVNYATQYLPIVASATTRKVAKGQAIYIDVSGVTFTAGCVAIQFAD